MRRVAILLGPVALLAACAQKPVPAPDGPLLSGAAFKTEIVGKKLHYVAADRDDGLTADATYNPDGTLSVRWATATAAGTGSGKWKIEGDTVCVDISRESGCRTWRKLNPTTFAEVNAGGDLHGTTTIVQ